MKTKKIIGLISLIIVVAIVYTLYSNKADMVSKAKIVEETFAIPVQTAIVGSMTISQGLVATGEFKGWEEVTLVAESQGSIQYLRVEEGQKIQKGQVIAKVDAVSLNSQLSSARSSYAKAEKDVARYERLEKVGAVSQSALEDSRIQLENAQANIAQIEQQLSFTSVVSPINGVVNALMVEESSFVMPGNEIAEIVQIDRLKIEVNVAEDNLSKIKQGQEVIIKTDVFPLETFKGSVRTISVKADASRKFKVIISVNNTDRDLRAGLFAEVYFNALPSNEQEAKIIPRQAIVGSLQNPSVYVVENEKAQLKKIQVGPIIDGNVVVLSGLKNGEQVVTKGIINLTNNTLVTVSDN